MTASPDLARSVSCQLRSAIRGRSSRQKREDGHSDLQGQVLHAVCVYTQPRRLVCLYRRRLSCTDRHGTCCSASRSATRRWLFGWAQIRMVIVWARACAIWNQLSEVISFVPSPGLNERPAQPSRKLGGRRRSARAFTTRRPGSPEPYTVYKPRRGFEGVSSALCASGHPPGRGAAGAHLAQTQTLACCARPSPLPMSSLAHQGNKVFVAIRSWGSLS